MRLTNATPNDIPVPAGMTVETEEHNGSLKRIKFKQDGRIVLQIEQPSSYESLKLLKPKPPETKEVWTLHMKFKDLVKNSKDFEHEHEALRAASDLSHEWEHSIEKRSIVVPE